VPTRGWDGPQPFSVRRQGSARGLPLAELPGPIGLAKVNGIFRSATFSRLGKKDGFTIGRQVVRYRPVEPGQVAPLGLPWSKSDYAGAVNARVSRTLPSLPTSSKAFSGYNAPGF